VRELVERGHAQLDIKDKQVPHPLQCSQRPARGKGMHARERLSLKQVACTTAARLIDGQARCCQGRVQPQRTVSGASRLRRPRTSAVPSRECESGV